MADKADVQKRMQIMVDKLNEIGPDSAAEWGGVVQFTFPDLATGWLVKMAMDGTVESCDEKIDEETADGVIEMDGDTFVGVIDKTLVPMEAFTVGKIKTRKGMDGLIKMMPAIM